MNHHPVRGALTVARALVEASILPGRGRSVVATTAAALAIAAATPGTTHAQGAPPAPSASWDLEVGGGVLVYTPSVANIPRGSNDTTAKPLLELTLGRRLSSRLEARLSIGHAGESVSEWVSANGAGTTSIPMPSLTSAFVSIETSLYRWRVTPIAGIGGGVVRWGEVDELITFDWTDYVETIRYRIDARSDGALLVDLGGVGDLSEALAFVVRYRLLSVFSGDQVNTIDRITASIRSRF